MRWHTASSDRPERTYAGNCSIRMHIHVLSHAWNRSISMSIRYLYRHDRLKNLLLQRMSDPVLRGRRSDGTGAFGHWQIKSAHAKVLDQAEAVYTLSFWRTFESSKRNRFGIERGAVIQRVREDHPSLRRYQRGDDEFIPFEEAWLYWATLPLSDSAKIRAPIGIPHTDIEVLHPSGQWMPMNEIAVLANTLGTSWKSVVEKSSVETRHVYWQQSTLPDGSKVVLLRQPYGFHRTSYNVETDLAMIVEAIVEDGKIACDDYSRIRWFHVWEGADEVLGEEVFVTITRNRTSGIRGIIDRWRGIEPTRKWAVCSSKPTRNCEYQEVQMLYHAYGLSEMFRRGERWVNLI